MKESMYNMYFSADDGTELAFNSYSCGLAIVDNDYHNLMSQLKNIDKNNVPDNIKECYESAVEGHFIVENECDELTDLYTKRNFQKFSMDSLGLTIAPTIACNFKCEYCYETSKPGIIKENVIDSILKFVERESNDLKNLSISWYGGEPLLAKNEIYYMSNRLISICKKRGIEYNAFMISNGSLLDDETIANLIKYCVTGIQITIDGPPDIHNKRRRNKAGLGTFDLLIENINKLLKTEKIEVVIRINIDKSNDSQVDQLLEILSDRLIDKNVKISFGQVTAYTDACKTIENNCFNNAEFAKKIVELYDYLEKYGFSEYNDFPYPEVKLNYCCAELLNSFVIDPEGYLYKCWNEVGNTSSAVGNICDENFDILGYKNGRWIKRNPIYDEKCSKCQLLPICMGGCPHNDMVLNNRGVCDMIKYNIEETMLKYYNMLK